MKFTRTWAMPSADTFDCGPIKGFVQKYLLKSRRSIDAFARNKTWATYRNDINPNTAARQHLDARIFLSNLKAIGIKADLVLFDPPYSPRQISEHYKAAGLSVTGEDTQNSKLYSECKALFDKLTNPGSVVLSFGWNSAGMGTGWEIEEILLVCHGGAHNDTICMAERKLSDHPNLFPPPHDTP